jgi:hypothetical protein
MQRTAKFARFVIVVFALFLGLTAQAADEEKGGGGMAPVTTQRP